MSYKHTVIQLIKKYIKNHKNGSTSNNYPNFDAKIIPY